MARHSSKTLLPKLLGVRKILKVMLQASSSCHNLKWQRNETINGPETETEERPHYFALRLQKLGIDFYLTLSEDNIKSYDETAKVFRHYFEKLVVFRGG